MRESGVFDSDGQHVRVLDANNVPNKIALFLMTTSSGLRSSPLPRSLAASKFDGDLLKGYMAKLLPSTLQNNSWSEAKERDNAKSWMKEIGERVKQRMLEIQPRGLCV